MIDRGCVRFRVLRDSGDRTRRSWSASSGAKGKERLSWEETPRERGLYSLEKKSLREHLINPCKYLQGGYHRMVPDYFQWCPAAGQGLKAIS